MKKYTCAFIPKVTLLLALHNHRHQGYSQCHALLPSPKALRTSIAASSPPPFKQFNGHRRTAIVRTNLSHDDDPNGLDDDDAWNEEASDAILSGQGDFFDFRGGDNGNTAKNSDASARSRLKEGYERRTAADPSFLSKSILEIVLAASTQCAAEVGRRGRRRMLAEVDFVFAGVLTAVCGKYYSMWRVARTADADAAGAADGEAEGSVGDASGTGSWRDDVPTNAFQPHLLDGRTAPELSSRFLAFLLPMPQLFRAGVIASTIGYGLTWLLIRIRTMAVPDYAVATKPVSVPLAAIYTGVFMALVSNVRYQLLQGIVEPYFIDGAFLKIEALGNHDERARGRIPGKMKFLRYFKRLVIVLVRWANGLLGSWIAIGGMRALGLQQLK